MRMTGVGENDEDNYAKYENDDKDDDYEDLDKEAIELSEAMERRRVKDNGSKSHFT
jgi:hypothetical protein